MVLEDRRPITRNPVRADRGRRERTPCNFIGRKCAAAFQVVRDAAIEPNEAVRERPELAGTHVALRAAALAARSLRDPEDQAQFVSRVREALADGIQSGEPLITVGVREGRETRCPSGRSAEARDWIVQTLPLNCQPHTTGTILENQAFETACSPERRRAKTAPLAASIPRCTEFSQIQ
jgi:hypothetical protein